MELGSGSEKSEFVRVLLWGGSAPFAGALGEAA